VRAKVGLIVEMQATRRIKNGAQAGSNRLIGIVLFLTLSAINSFVAPNIALSPGRLELSCRVEEPSTASLADIWLVQVLADSGRHRHFIVSNFAQTPPSARCRCSGVVNSCSRFINLKQRYV
jgi:hypothetical protein